MKEKENFTAMILAAGYGTRLRPITDEVPKPLIPVGDRTLLENILLNIKNAGVAHFAINSHHLTDMISNSIAESSWKNSVTVLYEEKILGTGGPMVNAKKILNSGNGFLLHNGDILTDIDLSELMNVHLSNPSNLVTMVMIDGPENRVAVNQENRVVDILGRLGKEKNCKLFTYAGIACFSPKIFEYLPKNPENYSIITAILDLMKDNFESIAAYIPKGQFFWNDLGTVEKFIAVHQEISESKLRLPSLSIEKQIPLPMQILQQQGSGRLFFRINGKKKIPSKVLMCASNDNSDFERVINIWDFLHKKHLGSPAIFNTNYDNHTVIMEDLGNDTLYNLVKSCETRKEVETLYQKVVQWLVQFQVQTFDQILPEGDCEVCNDKLTLRPFDYDYLRWETTYFRDNFLEKYCKIDALQLLELDEEFDAIAKDALTAPQVMIHRDFQSQNILIKDCNVRIVDFQGARVGHIAYDVMSLLNDPYIHLDEDLRFSLFEYYFNLLAETPILLPLLETKALRSIMAIVHPIALQRGMQAVGAYAFLSMTKGKKEYRQFIKPGLQILHETLQSREEYPKLQALIDNIKASSEILIC